MLTQELDILSNVDTKVAVVDAMAEIMKTVPFDKVKVVDICAASGVSRTSFYRLFNDKYAVVQWLIRYGYYQGAAQIGRTLSWYEGYYTTELYVMRHKDFYASAAKSNDYNAIDNFAPRYRRETLIQTLTECYNIEMTPHLLFDIDATVTLECTLFPRWHYGLIDADLETVCRWMTQNVPAQLFGLLNTPKEQRGKL